MDEGPRSTVLPLLLLVTVIAVVGLALYLSFAPAPGTNGGKPDQPSPEPEPPIVDNVPKVPDNGRKPDVVAGGAGWIIHGTVVDDRGEPVPGAIVNLYPQRPPKARVTLTGDADRKRRQVGELYQRFPEDAESLYPLSAAPERPVTEDPPIASVITMENGDFRFKRPYSGRHRILATKGRLSSGEQTVRAGKPLNLTLRPAASLFGLVRFRDDSRPIAGATVRVRTAGVDRSVATGPNGTFEIPGLPPGKVTVDVTHPEYAGEILSPLALEGGVTKEIEVQLTKGVTLELTVLDMEEEDENGEEVPVAGATVTALRIADDGYVIGTSDEKGKVVFEGLPPGDYYVNGIAEGFLALGEERVKVRVNPRGKVEYDVYLERAVYCTLLVVDDRDVPIAGASVMTSDPDEEFHAKISREVGRTDRDGKFRFAFDFDGMRAVVYVMKESYAVGIVTPDDPYEPETIRVVLPKARIVKGRVTDETGRPVPGAKIYLEVMGDDADAEDLAATLYTDSNGEYRWNFLPPGEVWLEVEKEGYESGDADFETGPQREHVKNFTLIKEEED